MREHERRAPRSSAFLLSWHSMMHSVDDLTVRQPVIFYTTTSMATAQNRSMGVAFGIRLGLDMATSMA